MQSVSSRIWTRVAVSICYDDNHYTTGTSLCFYSHFCFELLLLCQSMLSMLFLITVISITLLLINSLVHFSVPKSILISWLYILIDCIRVFNSFSSFAKSLISSMYIWSFIFSWYFVNMKCPVHFQSMCLIGWLVGRLVGWFCFTAYQPFSGHLTPN